jgi:hypothetical protein
MTAHCGCSEHHCAHRRVYEFLADGRFFRRIIYL